MDKRLKAQWIKELRSGLYVQGIGRTHRRVARSEVINNDRFFRVPPGLELGDGPIDCFCAIGVLANILQPTVPNLKLWDDYDYLGGLAHLNSDQRGRIIQMNDDEHKTFAEIADYVEVNV